MNTQDATEGHLDHSLTLIHYYDRALLINLFSQLNTEAQ